MRRMTPAAGAEPRSQALSHLRICDLSGQLAGAGATRFLAACGAQVIRVEDPVRQGTWDILRGVPPYVDDRRGVDFGGAFNNHNVEKLGITIDLRQERGTDLLRRLVAVSDAVTENFAAGVFARLGFSYDDLRAIKPDIVYVSNSGFGARGPYTAFKTWGPIVQAASGLTFSSGLPDLPPAGWGFSYMDHMGANMMAVALLAALVHRNRTGEGQWIDMACTEAGIALVGPDVLDFTVNGRPLRRDGQPHSNRNRMPAMAPHGIYPTRGDDDWVAIACRDDDDWARLVELFDEPWAKDAAYATLAGRLADEDRLDQHVAAWTASRDRGDVADAVRARGVPTSIVARPEDRIDHDAATSEFGMWPTAHHREMGDVRVDGVPLHFSETDWSITRGGPCLGEHTRDVLRDVLGIPDDEIDGLERDGVV
jgi:crotonobetainyl-CoA:carnitine CoA-transferase CaiB-like acyl-CoA transferase